MVLVPGGVSGGAAVRQDGVLPCQNYQQPLDVLQFQAVVPAQQHFVADHVLEAIA